MMRSLWFRLGLVAFLIASTAGGLSWTRRVLWPAPGQVATGVRVAGEAVAPGQSPRQVADAVADAVLARTVVVSLEGEPLLEATAGDLGARVDVDGLTAALARIGRQGDPFRQLEDVLAARRGEIDIPVRLFVDDRELAQRLAAHKETFDHRPVPARLYVGSGDITPHEVGRYIDVPATAERIHRAIASSEPAVDAALHREQPAASTEVAKSLDTSVVVSTYETRFSYGQAGRAKNIERASALLDGTLLMPGEVVSFNDLVGPRSIENGFFHAPEIYRGEMREGVGGGSCQVASTLYAAAFFGGLDVVERRNHSRPSGYIRIGLDATVSYPVLDLKVKNPFDFPIVIRSVVDRLGIVRFELLGPEPTAKVELSTATIGYRDYKRKVRKASWLPEGEYKLKQEGKRGVSIKRVRKIRLERGGERIEEDTDVYPPTAEVYLVAPSLDVDEALPPLPSDDV